MFIPAKEGIHIPSSLSAQICLLLQQGEPGEAELTLPLKQHLVKLTDTPGSAHRHTWSRSQTYLVPLTDTPGPAHRHTWSSSQAHLVQLTGTPGPAHRHTWSRSQTLGPVAGTSLSWIPGPPGWDTVLKSRRGGGCGV